MVFYEEKWNYDLCTMTEMEVESKDTYYFKCDCRVPGFIGVGMVIIDDDTSTILDNTVEILWHYNKDVSFK